VGDGACARTPTALSPGTTVCTVPTTTTLGRRDARHDGVVDRQRASFVGVGDEGDRVPLRTERRALASRFEMNLRTHNAFTTHVTCTIG
jgi:hypothetical protein